MLIDGMRVVSQCPKGVNDIEFVKIPGDEDKTRKVYLKHGPEIGIVFRGWLAAGGNQWVVQLTKEKAPFGVATLAAAKKEIVRRV